MHKNILIGAAVLAVLGGSALFLLGDKEDQSVLDTSCGEVCATAYETCPSLIDKSLCASKCASMSEETKEHLRTTDSCEALTARPDLIADILIPEMGDTSEYEDTATASQGCEAACGHYVASCLSLVPNATEALFDDGYQSCMSECAGWSATKVECMVGAVNCEAMTNQCGL